MVIAFEFKKANWLRLFLVGSIFCVALPASGGFVVIGGSATWNINEGQIDALHQLNAYFDESKSRAATLGDAAPGNVAFTSSNGTAQLVDPIRSAGVIPLSGDGRTRQQTTLEFDSPANVLDSWTAATSDIGAFVSGGEQIAFQNMQRWALDPNVSPGVLLFGDFAMRYSTDRQGVVRTGGTLSGLVLTSNIDFLNAAFLDLANTSFSSLGNQLTISGDLLVSDGLGLLDANALVGSKIGTFTLNANISAVPEPSSLALISIASSGLIVRRKLKFKRPRRVQ